MSVVSSGLRYVLCIVSFMAWLPASATQTQRVQRGEFAFSIGDEPDWVNVATVAPEWDAKAPGMSGERWRHWLVDAQFSRLEGKRERYLDIAYEPVLPELVTEAGKVQLDFNPQYQQLTVHEIRLRRAGEWQDRLKADQFTLARREAEFERDMSTGMVTAMLVLDDVRAGDVVRIRYSVSGANPIMAGLHNEGGAFAWGAPILDQHLRVLFDPKATVTEYRDTGAPAGKVVHTATAQEWRYTAHATARIEPQDQTPAWYSATPRIYLGEKRSWRDIARWADALYPPHAPLPPDLQENISKWKQLPDDEARITAALLAVQEQVRYFGVEIGDSTHRPAEPADTWTLRRGDCKDKTRLLVAILRSLGITARPALVSAERGKGIEKYPPSASLFDHVIVQVQLAGDTLWLDPTRTQQRGSARAQEVGDFGVALVVDAQSDRLVPVARNPAFVDENRVVEHFAISKDGAATQLQVRSEFTGASANHVRQEWQTSGIDGMARSYAEFTRRRYGELKEEPLKIDDDEKANRIVIVERYALTNPWVAKVVAERLIDSYPDQIAASVRLPGVLQRTAPLGQTFPSRRHHRVEIALPDGWRWLGSAGKKDLPDPAGRYALEMGQKDGVVFADHAYEALTDTVSTNVMADHLKWRRDVSDALSQRWAFALPGREADKARDDRLKNLLRGVMEDRKGNTKGKNP